MSLVAALEHGATRGPGTVTFLGDHPPEAIAYATMHDDARRQAVALGRLGIGPGAVVALCGPTSRALVTALQAVWLVGGTVAILPPPAGRRRHHGVAEVFSRCRHLPADLLVVDDRLWSSAAEDLPADIDHVTLAQLEVEGRAHGGDYLAPANPAADAAAVIQYTSGSTSSPKGVQLTHGMVLANVRAMVQRIEVTPERDVGLSWLPLFHDMGLFAFTVLPMVTGTPTLLADPRIFALSPRRWLEWITAFGPTVTGAPNFAYALAARLLERGATTFDLSSVRVAFDGAESVDPAVLRRFSASAAGTGWSDSAYSCVYGMAEATLAVTVPRRSTGYRTDIVDRDELSKGRAMHREAGPGSRELVHLGPAVDGVDVEVVADDGSVLPERCVGEIRLRGATVMRSYLHEPDATCEAFDTEHRLRTGDLGYLSDGELVVCGRRKDVIIIGGRNIYPDEVERAVERLDGVRAGNVIAFSLADAGGPEAFVVVAEVRRSDPCGVREVVGVVAEEVGLRPADVLLVKAGQIPKTTSGKLRRSLCRERYLAGELVCREAS